jgi:hypothetical protein
MLIDELGNFTAALDTSYYGVVQDDGTITNDPYDIDTTEVGRHSVLRVKYAGVDPGPVESLGGIYPTCIEEGKYSLMVSTFGYIQRDDASIYITPDLTSGLQVDLVQGAQIRVELEFRRADEPTVFNGFARVEIYDQQDNLVGASIYAGADPNPNLHYLPYDPSRDWKLIPGAAEGAGTQEEPQRAFFSQLFYGIPSATWADWPGMMPSDANRLSMLSNATVVFDVFGFHSYHGASDSRIDRLWANGWDTTNGVPQPDSGIRGSWDVKDLEGWGNFTVRVWAFDPYGPNGVFDSNGPDGLFGTSDDYTSPDNADGSPSDFRAYGQTSQVTSIEARWGGAVTAHVTLEEQPTLLGVTYWTDMYGNVRTLPWAQVIETSPGSTWTSTTTGSYRLWLSEGSHEFLVTTIGEEELWELMRLEITVAGSGACTFRDVVLTPAAIPTPEFTNPAWTTLIPLSVLMIFLSRRRHKRTEN